MLQESCKNTQEENNQAQMWKWTKELKMKKLKKEHWKKQIEKTQMKKIEDEGE
jgi:hypothetical protein